MKKQLIVCIALAIAPLAQAADIEAGRLKASTVCAACHGANGVSVADNVPHLAAQRAPYLEAQLGALKSGERKHAVMNAIAAQLSETEIADLAAYFASLPGAGPGAKSELLASVATSHMSFPQGYETTFTRYHTIDFPDRGQVRHYFANDVAVRAARDGRALPDGSVILAEVYAAKKGADGKPVTGADGFFEPAKLIFYTGMARAAGWGKDIPEMLRNEDWNYAVFSAEKAPRSTNQAVCLACHKPLDKVSYTFTLEQLARAK